MSLVVTRAVLVTMINVRTTNATNIDRNKMWFVSDCADVAIELSVICWLSKGLTTALELV